MIEAEALRQDHNVVKPNIRVVKTTRKEYTEEQCT